MPAVTCSQAVTPTRQIRKLPTNYTSDELDKKIKKANASEMLEIFQHVRQFYPEKLKEWKGESQIFILMSLIISNWNKQASLYRLFSNYNIDNVRACLGIKEPTVNASLNKRAFVPKEAMERITANTRIYRAVHGDPTGGKEARRVAFLDCVRSVHLTNLFWIF